MIWLRISRLDNDYIQNYREMTIADVDKIMYLSFLCGF